MQRSYTLDELAKFLRRQPKQLQKLAENGTLKGRKVQGDWVFALPDVVLWMETEIVEPESHNDEFEKTLATGADDEETSLADIFAENAIDLNFPAKTKESVIRNITKLAADAGILWDADGMADALREREEMASTALDVGVAILHPRQPQPHIIAENFLALGVAGRGVPFGGGFNNLTDVFFLLCCDSDRVYLRMLNRLARVLKSDGFLDALRECATPFDAKKLLADAEKALD